MRRWLGIAWVVLLGLTTRALAEVVTVPVGFDRWMYPYNVTPGTRASGSVFGALGSSDFDNRDGQVLLGFDLSQVTPPSAGQKLVAITLRVTIAADDIFVYDPTYDTLDSYTTGVDPDAGRPIELFGVATRNGFSGLTLDDNSPDPTLFRENSPFTNQPSGFVGTRSAFAADFSQGMPIDVSNSVSQGVEQPPWAIGMTDMLAAGELVPIQTEFQFQLPFSNANVSDYVDQAMAGGSLFLALTGLHEASQTGAPSYPSFYLDAGGVQLGPTAALDLEFAAGNLPGDFDGDGSFACPDVDALVTEIASGGGNLTFDLTQDGQIDLDDLDRWRALAGQANLPSGNAYLPADANLDGLVDGSDFGIWNSHKFTATAAWCQGDVNADGVTDGSDFGIWNSYKFQAADRVTAVPEPGAGWSLWVLSTFLLSPHRRRGDSLATS